MGHSEFDPASQERRPWNAGRMVGAKRALKPQSMEAKADAWEGLIQSGVLSDPLGDRTTAEKEIGALRSANAVDTELEKLLLQGRLLLGQRRPG